MVNVSSINYNHAKVKGFVAELTHFHVQNAWGSRREIIRTMGLATCCNYF